MGTPNTNVSNNFLNITKDFPGLADLPNWKTETFD
jgi:hypothetical protein